MTTKKAEPQELPKRRLAPGEWFVIAGTVTAVVGVAGFDWRVALVVLGVWTAYVGWLLLSNAGPVIAEKPVERTKN